jgi:hypothetical protein
MSEQPSERLKLTKKEDERARRLTMTYTANPKSVGVVDLQKVAGVS